MFARLVTVHMRPGSRYVAERLAGRWQAGVAMLPGFVSVSFFLDDEAGEYGYFSLWRTREDAETVIDEMGDQVDNALAEMETGPRSLRIYEVYEPPA